MLSPHLSSTPLGTGRRSGPPGIHSGVWLLPDPWDSHPSVVLTELRTEVSLCCDGSSLYTGSNPILTGRFALLPGGNRCASPLMWLLITGLCLKNDMYFSRCSARSFLAPYMFKFIPVERKSLGTGSTGCPPWLYGLAGLCAAMACRRHNKKTSAKREPYKYTFLTAIFEVQYS